MHFLNVWYGDSYMFWSKILFSTIPTHLHDLYVKDMDKEILSGNFYVKVF